MAKRVTVTINQTRLDIKVTGITTRHARLLMEETNAAAKLNALEGPYATGNLARKMYTFGPQMRGLTSRATIGNVADYANIVENGAGVHEIFPRGAPHFYRFGDLGTYAKPQLRFFWRKAGRVVFAPHIPMSPETIGRSHPGQKPKRFLIGALEQVAHRHGYRVRYEF